MSTGLSQDERYITVDKFGGIEFVPVSFVGQEEISKPFRYVVDLVSEDLAVDAKNVLGKSAAITLKSHDDQLRYFHGIVWSLSSGDLIEPLDASLRNYQAELVPWTYMLKLAKNSRVFQEKTAPQIVEQVFKDAGYTDFKLSLKGTYAKEDYRVQYNETSYDFISRVMEEVGIFYYFTHDNQKHEMVLADTASAYVDCEAPSVSSFESEFAAFDQLKHWSHSQNSSVPEKYTIASYDFESPAKVVEAKEKTKVKIVPGTGSEQFEFTGRFVKSADGKSLAVAAIETFESKFDTAEGQGFNDTFRPGCKFKIEEHSIEGEVKQKYVLTKVEHFAREPLLAASGQSMNTPSNDEPLYWNQFQCIPFNVPYRPSRVTPQPVVHGIQLAKVVGPKGAEIHSDKYGRIKVQFHWDREGMFDEKSSCWMRVAQSWAGAKFGTQFIPRVGSEVLVDFINGEIDRPIVIGSVYNAENMPIYDPVDQATISGVKTKSTDKAKAKNFNELTFDDKIGAEKIYFHAERDFERVVENDDKLKIGFDAKDKGDQTIDIYNDRTVTIDKGNDKLLIKTGERTAEIDKGNDTLTLKQGNLKIAVKAGATDIEAAKAITLKVGGSSIKIDTQGISIKGPQVKIQGQVKVDIKATMTGVSGDGMLTLKGGLVKIN